MKWPKFHLTLPDHDDVVDFNINCKADRAVWREHRANQQPIKPIVSEEGDLSVESESFTTVPSNEAKTIGNEAEENAGAKVDQEVADVEETEDAVVTSRLKNALELLAL
jgi:hypothetical protein